MLELILLVSVLLMFGVLVLITVEGRKKKEIDPNDYKIPNVYMLGLSPDTQAFPEKQYQVPIIPTVPLSQSMEGISENRLVDFGPYFFGINGASLAIVDSNGGRHRIFLGENIRITYADNMILKINTPKTEIIISKGSPFISVSNPNIKIQTDSGNITPIRRKAPRGYYNWSILPNNDSLELLLTLNSDILLSSIHINSNMSLTWWREGTSNLLMLIPANLTPVAKFTGIYLETNKGIFRLERGNVWEYSLQSFYQVKSNINPSDIDDIVYDPLRRRLVDMSDVYNSVQKILKWLENNYKSTDNSKIYSILRSNFKIIKNDKFFVDWYSVDFYFRTTPMLKSEVVKDIEILYHLYSKLVN